MSYESGKKIPEFREADIYLPHNFYERLIPNPVHDALVMSIDKQTTQDRIQAAYAQGLPFYGKYLEELYARKYHEETLDIDRTARINKINERASNILSETLKHNAKNEKLDQILVKENPQNHIRNQVPAPLLSETIPSAPDLNSILMRPVSNFDEPVLEIKRQPAKMKTEDHVVDKKELAKLFKRFVPNENDLSESISKLKKTKPVVKKKASNYHPLKLDPELLKEAKKKLKEREPDNYVSDFSAFTHDDNTARNDHDSSYGTKDDSQIQTSSSSIGSGKKKEKEKKVRFALVDRVNLNGIKKGRGKFQEQPRIPFGKFELNEPELKNNSKLVVRYRKNKSSVRDLPARGLSEHVKNFIEAMIYLRDKGDPDWNDILEHPILKHLVAQMNSEETDEILDFLGRSGIFLSREYKRLKAFKNQKARQRLELLLSAIENGNDANEIRQEITDITYRLKKNNIITAKQSNDLILEMHKMIA